VLYLLIPALGISTLAVEFLVGSIFFLAMRWVYLRKFFQETFRLRDFLLPTKQDLIDIRTFVWSRIRGLKTSVYERIT
jgi:hypothetical protein